MRHTAALQDCFYCTDRKMFRGAVTQQKNISLEEYSSSVTSYISRCVDELEGLDNWRGQSSVLSVGCTPLERETGEDLITNNTKEIRQQIQNITGHRVAVAPASCYQMVASSIPLACMSKCPWERYWTPNYSWYAGLTWQLPPSVCEYMYQLM